MVMGRGGVHACCCGEGVADVGKGDGESGWCVGGVERDNNFFVRLFEPNWLLISVETR